MPLAEKFIHVAVESKCQPAHQISTSSVD